METGHQCTHNVVMRFAQIHYGRSVYDPVQRDSAIAQHESQPDEHRSQLRCFAPWSWPIVYWLITWRRLLCTCFLSINMMFFDMASSRFSTWTKPSWIFLVFSTMPSFLLAILSEKDTLRLGDNLDKLFVEIFEKTWKDVILLYLHLGVAIVEAEPNSLLICFPAMNRLLRHFTTTFPT